MTRRAAVDALAEVDRDVRAVERALEAFHVPAGVPESPAAGARACVAAALVHLGEAASQVRLARALVDTADD